MEYREYVITEQGKNVYSLNFLVTEQIKREMAKVEPNKKVLMFLEMIQKRISDYETGGEYTYYDLVDAVIITLSNLCDEITLLEGRIEKD